MEGITQFRRRNGGVAWTKVATWVGTGRSGGDIGARYRNSLDPSLSRFNRGPMNKEEVLILHFPVIECA